MNLRDFVSGRIKNLVFVSWFIQLHGSHCFMFFHSYFPFNEHSASEPYHFVSPSWTSILIELRVARSCSMPTRSDSARALLIESDLVYFASEQYHCVNDSTNLTVYSEYVRLPVYSGVCVVKACTSEVEQQWFILRSWVRSQSALFLLY